MNREEEDAVAVLWNTVVLCVQLLRERRIAEAVHRLAPKVEHRLELLAHHRRDILKAGETRLQYFKRVADIPYDARPRSRTFGEAVLKPGLRNGLAVVNHRAVRRV